MIEKGFPNFEDLRILPMLSTHVMIAFLINFLFVCLFLCFYFFVLKSERDEGVAYGEREREF